MLHDHITRFLDYCKNADFSERSIESLNHRLEEFGKFLKLIKIIDDNIATQIPYPKIEKKVPAFLTIEEFKLVLNHFIQKATLRDLSLQAPENQKVVSDEITCV